MDSKEKMEEMQKKIKQLEEKNEKLLNENIILKINQFSPKLIELINFDNFTDFKSLIDYWNYPINSYFSEETHLSTYTPLLYWVEKQKIDFVYYLIKERKANPNIVEKKENWSSLMYAIENKNTELVKFLLENKADINHIDIDGFSPLAIAVDTQNAEIINLLLTYNPTFDNKDVVIGLLDLVEDENIVKTICRYYGIEKQKENEEDISADSK